MKRVLKKEKKNSKSKKVKKRRISSFEKKIKIKKRHEEQLRGTYQRIING